MFRLQFPAKHIKYWADRYVDKQNHKDREEEKRIIKEIGPRIRHKKFIDKEDFQAICNWKTKWATRYYNYNQPDFIRAITKTAFSTNDERLRIEVLTLLKGVGWPVASALLHFMLPNKYPILDFRALESLGQDVPKKYDFEFWDKYVKYCRKHAKENGVTLRVLDRALWQFSKEKGKLG